MSDKVNQNEVILQSILLPTDDLCREERVYYHEDGLVQDFDGYFNLFYIEKRKKYTSITELVVRIILKGYSKIVMMHDREEIRTEILDEPDKKRAYTFCFPYESYDNGVFWFRLFKTSRDAETYISGYYAGIAEHKQRARVFVDICTFKREEYVIRNMERISTFLDDERNKYIADNLIISLIDNGQTLDDCSQMQDIITKHRQISVIQNTNTGGAGGFTRGMEEAISRKEKDSLTHVLVMDDDAVFDTDIFIRLFGVLSTLNERYKDLTIGGANWRLDYPYIQWASGEWWEKFRLINPIPALDLRSYEEVTQEEMCTTENELKRYSGWWCCCYSLNTVTHENLPMSKLFIHMDDVEFGIRNRINGNPIAFFNGIGLWHKSLDADFPGWRKYYDIRNTLVFLIETNQGCSRKDILRYIRKEMTGQLFNMRYLEMWLTYMGARDFLKGKEWLDSLDTEKFHASIMKYYKEHAKWIELKEIRRPIFASEFEIADGRLGEIPLKKIIPEKVDKREALAAIQFWHFFTLQCKKLTLNGWILPSKKKTYLLTPISGIWNGNYRYQANLFVPFDSDRGIVRKREYKQIWNMIKMYCELKKIYSKDFSYVSRSTK